MGKLKDNYLIFILTGIISAFTSTGASAFQLGGLKSDFGHTQEQVRSLQVKVDNLEQLFLESREDRKLLRQDMNYIKETISDIKNGVILLQRKEN